MHVVHLLRRKKNYRFYLQNDLDKACFQHDMTYGKYKYLNKRTQSDNVSRDETIEIASNPKYDGYQRGLASVVYNFFDRKSNGSGEIPNKQLANILYKSIIRKFKRRRVYSSFKDNIWGVDLADMDLIKNTIKELGIYNVPLIFLVNMHGLLL